MSQEIIYTMKGVSKVYPPNRYVLKNIYLSYFYGAKIGVLGLNGSGKSTLLKIMAGVDKDFWEKPFLLKKCECYLEQEPKLDEKLTVKENIFSGMGELPKIMKDYNEISEKFNDPQISDPDLMNDLIEKQGRLFRKK